VANDQTGISRISVHGASLRIEGVSEGRRSDVLLSREAVDAYRKTYGEKETQAMFHRSLAGGREGQHYDLTP
jgi:hypothetical protein